MARKIPQTWQIVNENALSVLETAPREPLNNLNTVLANKLDFPFRVTMSGAVITIGSSEVQVLKSDGAGSTTNSFQIVTSPIDKVYQVFSQSTLNVSSGVTTGSLEVTPTSPIMTASYFIWLGFYAMNDGTIYLEWGNEGITSSAATYPNFIKGTPLAIILLQDNGAGGQWHFSNPIQLKIIRGAAAGGGQYVDATLIANKGDLLVGTAAATATNLPVGSDGEVLLANSFAPSGVSWGNLLFSKDAYGNITIDTTPAQVNSNWTLQDANLVKWDVTIDANGKVRTTSGSSNPITPLFYVTKPDASFAEITVSIAGDLIVNSPPVTAVNLNDTFYLASLTGVPWRITVNNSNELVVDASASFIYINVCNSSTLPAVPEITIPNKLPIALYDDGISKNFIFFDGTRWGNGQIMSPVYDNGVSGAVDFNKGVSQQIAIGLAPFTFTFSNANTGRAYVLKLVSTADGAKTITWPANVKWAWGAAYAFYPTTLNAINIINLFYDGTYFYANASGYQL